MGGKDGVDGVHLGPGRGMNNGSMASTSGGTESGQPPCELAQQLPRGKVDTSGEVVEDDNAGAWVLVVGDGGFDLRGGAVALGLAHSLDDILGQVDAVLPAPIWVRAVAPFLMSSAIDGR